MKVSRSYILGLGSGLILSALLTLVISPYQGQSSASKDAVPTQPVKQSLQSPSDTGKSSDTSSNDKSVLTQVPQVQTPKAQSTEMTPSSPSNVVQTERDFVIPAGASADRIADLLLDQGFIKDKPSFLASAHRLRADSKFQSGKFTLAAGLTPEELIHRLLKN